MMIDINNTVAVTFMLDPLPVKGKSQSSHKKCRHREKEDYSTRRDPSAFEHMEAKQALPSQRQRSNTGAVNAE